MRQQLFAGILSLGIFHYGQLTVEGRAAVGEGGTMTASNANALDSNQGNCYGTLFIPSLHTRLGT
jgi:hypothetical protein